MLQTTEEFIAYLEEQDVRYTIDENAQEDGVDRLGILFGGENMGTVCMYFIFDEDEEGVAVRVFDIVKVPVAKIDAALQVICDLNNKYRFVKFCFNRKDNTVQAEIDAPIRPGMADVLCYELMARCLHVCDDAYPHLMHAIWQ